MEKEQKSIIWFIADILKKKITSRNVPDIRFLLLFIRICSGFCCDSPPFILFCIYLLVFSNKNQID